MSDRLKQLEEMAAIVASMFKRADKEGLFIGMGYDPSLPLSKQEGRKVRSLRKLSAAIAQQRGSGEGGDA